MNVEISSSFKKQSVKATWAIVFFILSYLLILFLFTALSVGVLIAAASMVLLYPNAFTLTLGIALLALFIPVLVFLVKFVFKSHSIDRSHLKEISKEEEPRLFALIASIVDQVGTEFPKKVFLSTEVNAGVFYDSNFWSMFRPVKKNLQIGVGLVNSVNQQELEAILAHEFGHFSQKSMKLGSYVYNLNQIVHNMLYDNASFDDNIANLARMSTVLAIAFGLAFKIISGIQWVLVKLYEVLNVSYLALSKEMEFHADAIAAHVAGGEYLQSALLRLQLTEYALNSVYAFYEDKIQENIKCENIYEAQEWVTGFLAKDNALSIVNGFPQVTLKEYNKYNKSKLVVENQWDSHPRIEDRIARLDAVYPEHSLAKLDKANTIFMDFKTTHITMTEVLFHPVRYSQKPENLSLSEFKKTYEEQYQNNSFPELYKGYYDNNNPVGFAIEKAEESTLHIAFSDLFDSDRVNDVFSFLSMEQDIQVLKEIEESNFTAKTFDYDGVRYKRKEAKKLRWKLNKKVEELGKSIAENDLLIYKYFTTLEKLIKGEKRLQSMYEHFFTLDANFEDTHKTINLIGERLVFVGQTTPFKDIEANFRNLKPLEKKFKEEILVLLQNDFLQRDISSQMRINFEKYCGSELVYFKREAYVDENLTLLYDVMHQHAYLLSRRYFYVKKELLEYQQKLEEEPIPANL